MLQMQIQNALGSNVTQSINTKQVHKCQQKQKKQANFTQCHSTANQPISALHAPCTMHAYQFIYLQRAKKFNKIESEEQRSRD